jgi:hypothetical protein
MAGIRVIEASTELRQLCQQPQERDLVKSGPLPEFKASQDDVEALRLSMEGHVRLIFHYLWYLPLLTLLLEV